MKRNVFIIGAPLSLNDTLFSHGVRNDVINFYNFFHSPLGGGFYANEIITLINPSWQEINLKMLLNPADYSVIVFSGHGYMGIPSFLTKLKINENEEMPSVLDIASINHAPKQLFVIDACRNLIVERGQYLSFTGDPASDARMNFDTQLDWETARLAVQQGVYMAAPGTQIIYSCAPGEASRLSSSGSHFSKSLLQSAKDWASYADFKNVLLGIGAYRNARSYMGRYSKDQHPQIHHESGVNFPFAVKQQFGWPGYFHF